MSSDFKMQFDGVELRAHGKGRVLLLSMRDRGVSNWWNEVDGEVSRASVVRLRDWLNEWIGEDE